MRVAIDSVAGQARCPQMVEVGIDCRPESDFAFCYLPSFSKSREYACGTAQSYNSFRIALLKHSLPFFRSVFEIVLRVNVAPRLRSRSAETDRMAHS